MELDHLREWIGRREVRTDSITAAPLIGLAATLDRDDPDPRPGDPLPPAAHWLYFLPRVRQSELGPDGHARRGGFLPPVPLARRMYAGGRLWFHAPLRIGESARRESEVADVTVKQGRTGPLVFVRVRHAIFGKTGLTLTEEHDIVYRDRPAPGAPSPAPQPSPDGAVWSREIRPDPVLLFRYSALTFNGHRIHYDHPHVTGVEGYPGLVVHGPLTATLLMDLCRRNDGRPLLRFDFRAVSPLFDTAPFTVNGRPEGHIATLWAADAEGNLAMTAEAEFG